MGVIEKGTFVVLYINGRRTHVVGIEDGIAQAKLDVAFQVVIDPNSADVWSRDAADDAWVESHGGHAIVAELKAARFQVATLQRENDVLRGLPPCSQPKCESRARGSRDGVPYCEQHVSSEEPLP